MEHKGVKKKVIEQRDRADKAQKDVRRLNLQIGKLESTRGGVMPLGPNNGRGISFSRNEDEGRAFAVQHTALVAKVEALEKENSDLKRVQGDADVRERQVRLQWPSVARFNKERRGSRRATLLPWVDQAVEVATICRPADSTAAPPAVLMQEDTIAQLRLELSVAREQLTQQRSGVASGPPPSDVQPGAAESVLASAPSAASAISAQPETMQALRQAEETIASLRTKVATLEARQAEVQADAEQRQGALMRPEELDAIRTGKMGQDKTVTLLTTRVEQYNRSYKQAQARLATMEDKQRVCFHPLVHLPWDHECLRSSHRAAPLPRVLHFSVVPVQELTDMLEKAQETIRDLRVQLHTADTKAKHADHHEKENKQLREDNARLKASSFKLEERLLKARHGFHACNPQAPLTTHRDGVVLRAGGSVPGQCARRQSPRFANQAHGSTTGRGGRASKAPRPD